METNSHLQNSDNALFTRTRPLSTLLTRTLIVGIHGYQKYVSPDTGILFRSRTPICKFIPTCSHYAEHALQKKGFFYGSFLIIYRILRCNPWSRGGYDPII